MAEDKDPFAGLSFDDNGNDAFAGLSFDEPVKKKNLLLRLPHRVLLRLQELLLPFQKML